MKVYQQIAQTFDAFLNCIKNNNAKWLLKHEDKINEICKNYLPYGSGFNYGTRFDFDNSKHDKLIFLTDFHHMDENGFYDGWSENIKIIITPSFQDFNIKITGIRRKNSCDMEFYYDTFFNALNVEMKE